jgi:Winged helix DNA-binding domain
VIRSIFERRLRNQQLAGSRFRTAADVVAWLGAVQAQDFPGAKWALAQRVPGVVEADVDREFDEGRILRTHVLRPTWHFVSPEDIRWMVSLSAPRVHAVNNNYGRRHGLDDRAFAQSRKVLARALRAGRALTRAEMGTALARAGIAATGLRLVFLVMNAELDQVVCSGPRRGNQLTYMLLDERVPASRTLDRDAALAELARRYFSSHGPATIRDFVWWSGLTVRDAKAGIDANRSALVQETVGDRTYWSAAGGAAVRRRSSSLYLLPNYDEYLIAYKDRGTLADARSSRPAIPRTPDLTPHHLVIDGQVAGGWRRTTTKTSVRIEVSTRRPLARSERRALAAAAEHCGRFLNLEADLSIAR